MKPTICLRSVCEMPGTRLSTMRSSSFCSGKPICRCRQRRFSASPRSRSLFEVRITVGGTTAATVPSSGMVTWKSREDFQQQRFELGIRLVDLVDQQHAAGRLLQRLQQRPRLDEFLGEEHVAEIVQLLQRRMQRLGAAEHFAELVLQDLRVEQLLGVFPLIQRLGLVEAFVALQADQLHVRARRRSPWRARSCRRRPGLRPGSASRSAARDRPRSRSAGSRYSPARRGRFRRLRSRPAGRVSATGFNSGFAKFQGVLPAFPAKNKPRLASAGARQVPAFSA